MRSDKGERHARAFCSTGTDPVILQVNAKFKPFTDGGGLCSPGRWPPAERQTPKLPQERHALLGVVDHLQLDKKLLECHKAGFANAPWDVAAISAMAFDALGELDKTSRRPGLSREVPCGQPFMTNAIGALLERAGDPDASFMSSVGNGVSMGISDPIPRVPLICREKTKFRLPPHPEGPVSADSNYSSADTYKMEVKAKLAEEIPLGRIVGPGSRKEIADICGCSPDDLVVGKLACIKEGHDKFRTLWDGSWGYINHQVQNANQVEFPGLEEEKVILAWAQRQCSPAPPGGLATSPVGLLKFDVKGAHRLVKKVRSDWKYLAMQVDGNFYTNTVGTFGESTAAFWWGRVAGCFHRLLYYLGDKDSWGLVYADDSLWHYKLATFWQEAALAFLVLTMLGMPISWGKTRCGGSVSWVGFQINFTRWQCGVTDSRRVMVTEKATTLMESKWVMMDDLASLLGMLVHIGQALPQLRPLLQPGFALLHGLGSSGKRLWSLPAKKCLMHIIDMMNKTPMRRVWQNLRSCPGLAASDGSGGLVDFVVSSNKVLKYMVEVEPPPSSATLVSALPFGEKHRRKVSHVRELLGMPLPIKLFFRNRAGIGGWWSDSANPCRKDVHWFAEDLPEANFPWLFETPEGEVCSAGSSSTAVELLGIAVLLDLRLNALQRTSNRGCQSTSAGINMTSDADNKGCSFILSKLYTKTMPGSAILRHIADRVTVDDVECRVSWVPRDNNTWADDLSKNVFTGFDLSKRHVVDWTNYYDIKLDVQNYKDMLKAHKAALSQQQTNTDTIKICA